MGGFGEQRERAAVAEVHADQDDVGKFSGGCLDYWRVVVHDEDHHGEEGGDGAEDGDCDGHDCRGVAPLDVVDGYPVAI